MIKKALFPILLLLLVFVGVVGAQENATSTPEPTLTPPPDPNYFGSAIAIVGLVVILAVIVYGGFKMIRKWSRSSE